MSCMISMFSPPRGLLSSHQLPAGAQGIIVGLGNSEGQSALHHCCSEDCSTFDVEQTIVFRLLAHLYNILQ